MFRGARSLVRVTRSRSKDQLVNIWQPLVAKQKVCIALGLCIPLGAIHTGLSPVTIPSGNCWLPEEIM